MTRRDAELQSDTQRPRQRSAPWGASGGGGVRRGDLPKILISGSGHHRLEACGYSNGLHKLA